MMLQLEDRAVIALSGPEARDFLQGLVTNDVRRVSPDSSRYAALLTPQGKVLFDFLIGSDGETLYLDCTAEARDALLKRLSLYRLRAKVDIVPREDLIVVWSPAQDAGLSFARDPRHPNLGYRAVVRRPENSPDLGAKQFEALRLAEGMPEGKDFGQDRMFALDADLEELGGVAFDKGCYVGQELTARMKHRGTARKRLLPIVTVDENARLVPEAALIADAVEIGTLCASYGSRGFALVRLDRLAGAGDTEFEAADIRVRILRPEWLFS